MLRGLVVLLIAGVLLLAARSMLRGGGRRRPPFAAPVARWPWLIVPVVLVVIAVYGYALRYWAVGR